MAFKEFLSNVVNGLGGFMEGFGFASQAKDLRKWYNTNINKIDINDISKKATALILKANANVESKNKVIDKIQAKIDEVSGNGSLSVQNAFDLNREKQRLNQAEKDRNIAQARADIANNASYAVQEGLRSGDYAAAKQQVDDIASAYEKTI